MDLILVRHGQTAWNAHYKTQGKTDIPLDEAGRLQAKLVALRLAGMNFDAVYTSPLLRARETALEIAAPHKLPVRNHPLLAERDFGIWEGEEFPELLKKYPEDVRRWQEDPFAFTPKDAESLQSVYERCLAFLGELRARHGDDENVLVVGHSIPLRLIVAHAIGLPIQRLHSLRMDNAAYTRVRLGDTYNVLLVLNDTGHFEG